MKGYLLLVLLVATGVAAQTDKTPDKKTGTEHAAAAAKKHVKTEAVKATEGSAGKNETSSGRNRRSRQRRKSNRDRLKWRR